MLPDIELSRINGRKENLKDYADNCLLIVNVASQCGFTPQYADFQSLYVELNKMKFEILAFPCNQFGSQEPNSNDLINNFCKANYNVTFPIFEKIDVNGINSHPIYDFLKDKAPGVLGSKSIKWNFTKFLINNEGLVLKRYAPQTSIIEIRKDLMPILQC